MRQQTEVRTALHEAFERQVAHLVAIGYPAAAVLSDEAFLRLVAPLRERIGELATDGAGVGEGRVPLLLVVRREMVAGEEAIARVARKGKTGFTSMAAEDIQGFQTIAEVEVPGSAVYLLTDVDTGAATLDVTPEDGLQALRAAGRSPLTLEEGLALVTHYPELVRTGHGIYMLGSRRADRRVTALWLSRGRPRLGWCWAGNPHSWLGSASCGGRIGPR